MPKTLDRQKTSPSLHIMDTLLFVLAGSAMAVISVSFLLWLRF